MEGLSNDANAINTSEPDPLKWVLVGCGLWTVDGAQGGGHNVWNPGFQPNTAKYEITE